MHEFFIQLDTFSKRYFHSVGIDETLTPWGPREYRGGYPRGSIIHYTADDDIERVVKWFMREKYGSKASANCVVADRKYPSLAKFCEDLPLVEALPVTVVQCQFPNRPTYHATWVNQETYGIEALNAGEIRYEPTTDEYLSHWRRNHDPSEPEWSEPWHHQTKSPATGWYRHWEPYTVDQIQTIIMILRHLRVMYSELEPSWVLGHECVQSAQTPGVHTDKRDPGPLMPMPEIRECVFGGLSMSRDTDWVRSYEALPDYCDRQRTKLVQRWAAGEAQMMSVDDADLPSAEISWLRFQTKVLGLVDAPETPFGPVGKIALALMGYHTTGYGPDMGEEDRAAVKIFQRMMGIRGDAVPGPTTRKAVVDRLYDRGILMDVDA